MTEIESRLSEGSLVDLALQDMAVAFNIGQLKSTSVIAVGFEDYNVHVEAEQGEFVAKVFSKNRTDEEILRNVEILRAVNDSDVQHPEIMKLPNGDIHFVHASGLSMVVMRYVLGKTFYELQRSPTDEELGLIAAEAVKINRLDIAPEQLFDSWAIPNLRWMYEQTREHLDAEGARLVDEALKHFEQIPFDELPKAFVHGDIIKSNTILGDDGKVYVIDFSVANVYPRVQEVVVMAANLLADGEREGARTLRQRVDAAVGAYLQAGGELLEAELGCAYNYAIAGVAMEFLGSVYERLRGENAEEVAYWHNLGLAGLREALGSEV